MSASADTFLRPSSETILSFRSRVDDDTDSALADDLELRARLLRTTVYLDEDEREPYATWADRVASYTAADDWRRGRIARHCWRTGDSILHAGWLLFGSPTGRGCDCHAPDCETRRRHLELRGRRS